MCTHIVLKNKNSKLLSARTMDFSLELNPLALVFPRNYSVDFIYENPMNNHFAFSGLGKDVGKYYLADGINEHGLSCAALYFEGYAKYNEDCDKQKINLAPQEFLHWILASSKNVEDVIKNIQNINIVSYVLEFIAKAAPLHWVITDATGKSIIVEPLDGELVVEENKVGVLTNSPDLNWHYTNMRNYIALDINQLNPRKINDLTLQPFGQGSGSFGLPGDYTPPSRFVRAVFNKLSCRMEDSKDDLLIASFAILNNVMITKGSVKTAHNTIDYTQYVSSISHEDLTYYFKTYRNPNIRSFSLLNFDLDENKLIVLEIDDSFHSESIV